MEFVAKAKTNGLSSLSELHKVEGHDNFAYQREPKPNNASTQGISSGNNDYVSKTNAKAIGNVAKSTKFVSRIKNSKSNEEEGNKFEVQMPQVLKSGVLSDDFPPETFKGGVAKYNEMDASKRLKLLNFLCDESLTTLAMRNFIKNKILEFEANKKEARQKATVANKKEKQLRKTMRSDFAKIHKENTGVPLSSEEHNKILSQLRAQAKEAHDEMMEANNMISKKMQTCDVVRTGPIILEDNGLVLWKLKCFEEEPKFLLQDLGTFDDLSPYEKWLAFKAEQKEEIEKFLSSKR
ncbi:unnamed protein product [Arabidopsis arenosa]|uniref:WHIM1 domain-containing protein n=1 Tax=Arabidopsis arenosa TaxID=38785 RepID=A0A8S2AYA7_ARAAE|nr:unnamed protein product [Arabidopsis arenosa]